jgi:hypothetical protein
VAKEPGACTLDQARERFAQTLDGIANFLSVDVRRGVLKPALEDVGFIQKHGLILCEAAIRDKCLDGLRGMGATMGQQADQARAGARFKDLDVGVQHRGVVTGNDHRAVGVVGLRRLEGAAPLDGIEPTAEFLGDRQVERPAVLVDRLEEARQAGLLAWRAF